MAIRATSSALGHFEPELRYTFLPRCAQCHAPHPVAQKLPLLSTCPQCGCPSGAAVSRVERAKLYGLWGWVASLFLAIGKGLTALAKRF